MSLPIIGFVLVLCFSSLLAGMIIPGNNQYTLFKNESFQNISCSFEVVKQDYPGEIPDYTFKVKCLPSCSCKRANPTHRCVQLLASMKVLTTKTGEYHYRDYESGCICMEPKGSAHNNVVRKI